MSDADKKRPLWDLSSGSSMQGAAEWIRKRSGALLVLAVREQDVAFSIDAKLQPMDAVNLVRDELPRLLQMLIDQQAKKGKAR